MRTFSLALLSALLLANVAQAQKETSFELGTSLGASIGIGSGDTEVILGLPSPSFIGIPAVYFAWFATPSLMIEPQVGMAYTTVERQVVLNSNLQAGYLFTPNVYASAAVGYSRFGTFVTSATAGAGVGYRVVVKEHLALRTEARYRRWLCDGCDLNEVSLSIGFGTALR